MRFHHRLGLIALALTTGCSGPGPLGLSPKPSGDPIVYVPGSTSKVLVTSLASPMPLSGGATFNVSETNYNNGFSGTVVSWKNGRSAPCLVPSTPNSQQVQLAFAQPVSSNPSNPSACVPGDVEMIDFVDQFGQHGPPEYFVIQ